MATGLRSRAVSRPDEEAGSGAEGSEEELELEDEEDVEGAPRW